MTPQSSGADTRSCAPMTPRILSAILGGHSAEQVTHALRNGDKGFALAAVVMVWVVIFGFAVWS